MGSANIFHLVDYLLFLVDISVGTEDLQTMMEEEGLQFSRAQLEERLESSFPFGCWGLAVGGDGGRIIGGTWRSSVIISESGSFWRVTLTHGRRFEMRK